MDVISTFTLAILPIATLKVLVNDQVIYNILTSSLRPKPILYTLICLRKRAFRRILNRTLPILILSEQLFSLMAFRYIRNLHSYLLSFMKKTRPLEDVDSRQRDAAVDFDKKWEAGDFSDWDYPEHIPQPNGESSIWCGACKDCYLLPSFHLLWDLQVKSIMRSKPSMMHILHQRSTWKL